MRPPTPTTLRQHLLCAGGLVLVVLTAPFPSLQAVVHSALVLTLAPQPGAPLTGALWALAAGWTLELTLRLPPHLGGTAWADLTLVLIAGWTASRWPLDGPKDWLTRLGALAVLHVLLLHWMVRLAAGPHPWGWSWLWTLLSLPLWAWGAWRLLHPAAPTGRR